MPQDVRSDSRNVNPSNPISINARVPPKHREGNHHPMGISPKSPVLHFSFNPHAIGNRLLHDDPSHHRIHHHQLSRSWVPASPWENQQKKKKKKKSKKDKNNNNNNNNNNNQNNQNNSYHKKKKKIDYGSDQEAFIHPTRQTSVFLSTSVGSHRAHSYKSSPLLSQRPYQSKYARLLPPLHPVPSNSLSLKDIPSLFTQKSPILPTPQSNISINYNQFPKPGSKLDLLAEDVNKDQIKEEIVQSTWKPVLIRALVLILISIVGMGPFFAYDSVAALATRLEDKFNLSADNVGMLFSAYSAPNVVFIIFSGFVVDKYGTNK